MTYQGASMSQSRIVCVYLCDGSGRQMTHRFTFDEPAAIEDIGLIKPGIEWDHAKHKGKLENL
jgi:hypothetical protein